MNFTEYDYVKKFNFNKWNYIYYVISAKIEKCIHVFLAVGIEIT